jgi:hypothetical protein
MGIGELRIPESTDEFLDIMIEVKRNPSNFYPRALSPLRDAKSK